MMSTEKNTSWPKCAYVYTLIDAGAVPSTEASLAVILPPWAKCADENGTCTCKGIVRYGVTGSWSGSQAVATSIACNAAAFKRDPAVGSLKTCECAVDNYKLKVISTMIQTIGATTDSTATAVFKFFSFDTCKAAGSSKCAECHGDCDVDADCDTGLKCYQ